MLFDLRARGRRRTIKVIYTGLAILMGGGLILVGIGGNVSGGLFDAFNDSSGGGGNDAIEKKVERAEKTLQTQPRNQAALVALTRAQFQLAGTEFDDTTGKYSNDGRVKLAAAARSWERYLALDPSKPDPTLATLMVQAYGAEGLNKPDQAVRAQEIVVDSRPPSTGLYLQLAQLSYLAGQTRKGDLAAAKAVELAPKEQRKTLQLQLKQLKDDATNRPLGTQTDAG